MKIVLSVTSSPLLKAGSLTTKDFMKKDYLIYTGEEGMRDSKGVLIPWSKIQYKPMNKKLKTPTPELKAMKKTLIKSIKVYKTDKALKDYTWALCYPNAVIPPSLFTSRNKARKTNSARFPKGCVIRIYPIREKK